MKTPLDTRGSRANDDRSARLGEKQPDGTHAHRIAHRLDNRPAKRFPSPGGRVTVTSAHAEDQAGIGMTSGTETSSGDGAGTFATASGGPVPGRAAGPAEPGGSGSARSTGTTGFTGATGATGAIGAEPMLLYLIKQVELAVRSRLDDLLRPSGLTASQYTALTVLERHADMSSAQLARHSFVTAQSMAEMITALEGRGLIERHRDRADRRRLVVALTTDGRRLLDRYRDAVTALEAQMLAGLTKPEVSGLRRSLQACRANLARKAPLFSVTPG
jgi:DNA-binding MarR family transcriptional regulator